jgi:hypothetical protein
MTMKSDVVDLSVVLLRQTERAILVNETEDNSAQSVWLPKSKVEFDDVTLGTITTVTLPEWLATEKGLI